MGGQVINFNPHDPTKARMEQLEKDNFELRNSFALRSQEIQNSFAGLISGAQSQFNITSFNPLFQANIVAPLTLNYSFLNYFYKTHGIIQTAIEQPVLDALSSGDQTGSGVVIRSKQIDEDDLKHLHSFLDDEDIWGIIGQTKTWSRLFGGAAIIVNDGAKDMMQPLDMEGPIHYLKLYPASRWELTSAYKLDDAGAVLEENTPWQNIAAYNQDYYLFYGQRIHKSRVITMNGKEAPWMVRWQLQGWGMSEVERMIEDFNLYVRTRNVLYDLLNEAKVDVFGIDGMRELLITEGGQQKLLTRIATVQQAKNMNNALLMDKNDIYDQKQMTFTGISEVMKENRMAIASAVKMPISKIFGVAATGFSSGEDDLETYNSMVQSTIRTALRKPIRQVLNICMRYLWGYAPEDFTIEYKPLRVMSATEEEELKDKKFERGRSMYTMGLMSSKQMGEYCAKENLISVTTDAEEGREAEPPMMAQAGDGGEGGEGDNKKQKGTPPKPKSPEE